jgi:hypothetical protein
VHLSGIQKLYADFREHVIFARESLTIRNKRGITVPLDLAPAQTKLDKLIAHIRSLGKPVRIIALKARQVYISTGVAAQFFQQVPFQAGQRALIVAHETKACENIFGYYQQFQEGYKKFRGVIGLPAATVHTSKGNNKIEYANDSSFGILTAKNLKGGRSNSLRFLHLSEFAFWVNAKILMRGLMQTVPDDPDTMVIIESSANGKGGEFYRLWTDASDPSSESEWFVFFFAWWEHPEYTRPLNDRASFQASLTFEEQTLQSRYTLTLEQLHWRRWAIKNKCAGSIDSFHQEYPSCPEEAFLSSGRPRFSEVHINRMPRTADGLVGELFENQVGTRQVLAFQVSERGALIVYKKPQPNKRYIIGADSATGKDISDGNEPGNADPDYSVGCVIDADTGEQVAKLRGRLEPDLFGEYLCALGRWYNWAYLVPESNSVGLAVIQSILNHDYPPALIYKRRPQPDELFSGHQSVSVNLLGFETNLVTRVQLISRLDAAIREMSVAVRDPNTLAELLSFVIKANGRPEAQDGCHDDEVFALALCVQGIETAPAARALANIQKPKPPANVQTGLVKRYGKSPRQDSRGTLVRF